MSRARWLALCLLVAVLIAIGVAQTGAGTSVLRSVGLDEGAQAYTELYFAHPKVIADITQGLDTRDRRISFGFVIHNREHRARQYAWTITADAKPRTGGSRRVPVNGSALITPTVATGCESVRVVTRGRKTHRHRVLVPAGPTRVRVVVTLAAPRQSIDFIVPCKR